MSKWKDELERKKFIEENPDTMETFNNIIDNIFGKEDADDKDTSD